MIVGESGIFAPADLARLAQAGISTFLLVTCGKYGLDLAHAYAAHFSKVPRIEENNGLGLVVLHIEALIELIENRV